VVPVRRLRQPRWCGFIGLLHLHLHLLDCIVIRVVEQTLMAFSCYFWHFSDEVQLFSEEFGTYVCLLSMTTRPY
jgi:hypothetical protein